MIKVEDQNGLYKDPKTNTFVNRNLSEIEAARERKKLRVMNERKEQELSERVDKISDDLDRLTSMLEQLLEKENGTIR